MARIFLLHLLIFAIIMVSCQSGQENDSNGASTINYEPQSNTLPQEQVNTTNNLQLPQEGQASFYADRFHGRPTASGEIYDSTALTAAHRKLPFGTRVKVTNLSNNKSVVLRINDRGPHHPKRIIDVSQAAARKLGFVQKGLTRVRVEEAPE